jgi:hypothetical protein
VQTGFNVPKELHALMQFVQEDHTLQRRLGAILEPDAYERELRAVAAEHGIDWSADALKQMFAPDPLGMGHFGAAPIDVTGGWPGTGWIPTRAAPSELPVFDWSWFGDKRTDAPLFEDSIRKASAFPFDRMFRTRTDLEALLAGAHDADSVPLCGMVFHMSRCGSTLLSRMLGAPEHHLVASEPEPLDAVIKWAETIDAPSDLKIQALRAVVAALGRRRSPAWQRFFIKLDGWHILSHRLLRDAFPDVPWVFLHRDPVEVLVSLETMPGMQSVPGMLPERLIGIENPYAMPQDDYGALVLALFCEAAIEAHGTGNGMIIDYADLIPAALDTIPRHFGFIPTAQEQAAMAATAKVDAKNPSAKFRADSADKQSSADARTRELAEIHLMELHMRLQGFALAR